MGSFFIVHRCMTKFETYLKAVRNSSWVFWFVGKKLFFLRVCLTILHLLEFQPGSLYVAQSCYLSSQFLKGHTQIQEEVFPGFVCKILKGYTVHSDNVKKNPNISFTSATEFHLCLAAVLPANTDLHYESKKGQSLRMCRTKVMNTMNSLHLEQIFWL